MATPAEAMAQLERLMATGLLHHFGTVMTANEAHAAMGDVVPRAIAALSWREREALAQLLQETVNREYATALKSSR